MKRVMVFAFLLTSCQSMGPSDWHYSSHVTMMKSCRVACHPGRMANYDAMDGSCICAPRSKK